MIFHCNICIPYLWGGRDSMGLDCSGLVQNLYQMIGIELPRDTDLQAEYFSNHISESQLKLGDLIFGKDTRCTGIR